MCSASCAQTEELGLVADPNWDAMSLWLRTGIALTGPATKRLGEQGASLVDHLMLLQTGFASLGSSGRWGGVGGMLFHST